MADDTVVVRNALTRKDQGDADVDPDLEFTLSPSDVRGHIFIDPPLHIEEETPEDKCKFHAFRHGIGPAVSEEECQAKWDSLFLSDQEILDATKVEQRSPEWHALRLHRIGASVTYAFLGGCKMNLSPDIMQSMLYGSAVSTIPTFAMEHGTRCEPLCERDVMRGYVQDENRRAKETGSPRVSQCILEHEGTLIWRRYPMFNASIDGIAFVQYEDGKWDAFGCEWKCPMKKYGYNGVVPVKYYYQMQQQLTIYWDNGHIQRLLRDKGIDLGTDMVEGWAWRSMFGVWQKGFVLQRQFVPHDPERYMAHAETVVRRYKEHFIPRWVQRDRGDIAMPATDWMPSLHITVEESAHDVFDALFPEHGGSDEEEEEVDKVNKDERGTVAGLGKQFLLADDEL